MPKLNYSKALELVANNVGRDKRLSFQELADMIGLSESQTRHRFSLQTTRPTQAQIDSVARALSRFSEQQINTAVKDPKYFSKLLSTVVGTGKEISFESAARALGHSTTRQISGYASTRQSYPTSAEKREQVLRTVAFL